MLGTIQIEITSGTAIRSFKGILADIKRQADNGLVSQHVWLTCFQWIQYHDENMLKIMSQCTRNELIRLGVL